VGNQLRLVSLTGAVDHEDAQQDNRDAVEAVEHPRVSAAGELRRSIRGHRRGVAILLVRLLQRAGQEEATAPHLGGGQQQVDRAQEVGTHGREHHVQITRPAYMARQMEDQVGLQLVHESAGRL
jgi:hypothetical protein